MSLVSYIECDVCKKEITNKYYKCSRSSQLPTTNDVIAHCEFDVCQDCFNKINEFCKSLHEEPVTTEESCPNSVCSLY